MATSPTSTPKHRGVRSAKIPTRTFCTQRLPRGSKVDVELLEQSDQGNDEAATDGYDTSSAELDVSRRLPAKEKQASVQENLGPY